MRNWINLFIIILFATTCYSMVDQQIIRFHSDKINRSYCYGVVNELPQYSLEGVKLIRVYDIKQHNTHLGYYLWNSHIVVLLNGCDRETLIHELAHHQQFLYNVSFADAKAHRNFTQYCDKITNSMEG